MNQIRVMLVEDHTLVRMGFRALLGQIPHVVVVAEASDGRTALDLIHHHQPDVVLMDITMPELNGLEATARIAARYPTTRVIILSMHHSEEYVWRALRAGATGYLLKDAGRVELEQAIKEAVRGERYLSSAVSSQRVDTYFDRLGGEAPTPERLTPRQREILQLIAEGKTNKIIAQRLQISAKTVETHRTQLMEELGIRDTALLVRYAIRVGLVSADQNPGL
jgi:DNA-binding NarL/FixJ family response regulator